MRSVVLLRGINVGGHRKIAMADLRAWLSTTGFDDVRTYIQSGNVVLEHAPTLDVASRVREVIVENSGFDVPVIVRDAPQWTNVVAANPYAGVEPTRLHVSFLAEVPAATAVRAAANKEWGSEEYAVIGREVYLHLPDGMGRSVMAPRLTLIKEATTRNWNTVLALKDLATN